MSIRTVLITPRLRDKWNKHTYNSQESLSTGYLAAYIETKGYIADIINANTEDLGSAEIIERLKGKEYDCIGISCISQKSYSPSRELVLEIRKVFPDVHIVMGGLYPTLEYENILRDIPLDTIVLGEGEIPLSLLLEHLEAGIDTFEDIDGIAFMKNGKVFVNQPNRIEDLSSLPFPKRSKINFKQVVEKRLYMLAGKGCYGSCAYCSLRSIDRLKTRSYRAATNVIDEMEQLIKEHGINSFYFHDDIFYDQSKVSKKWLQEFHDEILRRNLSLKYRIYLRANDVVEEDIIMLKKSGLAQVYLGIESGVQRVLDEMNKKITAQDGIRAIQILQRNNVSVDIGFITLIPTMTFAELKENYDYLFNLGYYKVPNLNDRLNVYTGCEYERILQEKNLLLPKENFWDKQDYKFIDERVGRFHDLLQEIKLYLKPTTNLQDQIKKVLLERNTYDKYQELDKQYLKFWTDLIKRLLIDVENNLDSHTILENCYKQIDLNKAMTEEFYDKVS